MSSSSPGPASRSWIVRQHVADHEQGGFERAQAAPRLEIAKRPLIAYVSQHPCRLEVALSPPPPAPSIVTEPRERQASGRWVAVMPAPRGAPRKAKERRVLPESSQEAEDGQGRGPALRRRWNSPASRRLRSPLVSWRRSSVRFAKRLPAASTSMRHSTWTSPCRPGRRPRSRWRTLIG